MREERWVEHFFNLSRSIEIQPTTTTTITTNTINTTNHSRRWKNDKYLDFHQPPCIELYQILSETDDPGLKQICPLVWRPQMNATVLNTHLHTTFSASIREALLREQGVEGRAQGVRLHLITSLQALSLTWLH